MAILANKNGSLISVVNTDKPNKWKENCPKGSTFTLTEQQTHRKIFTGPNAVEEALVWIGEDK